MKTITCVIEDKTYLDLQHKYEKEVSIILRPRLKREKSKLRFCGEILDAAVKALEEGR